MKLAGQQPPKPSQTNTYKIFDNGLIPRRPRAPRPYPVSPSLPVYPLHIPRHYLGITIFQFLFSLDNAHRGDFQTPKLGTGIA